MCPRNLAHLGPIGDEGDQAHLAHLAGADWAGQREHFLDAGNQRRPQAGRRGNTTSAMCAAVSAMRRVLNEGQTPRPLQEKATKKSCPQSSQRARA